MDNQVITIETHEQFEKLMSSDPDFHRKVQYIIKRVMQKARAAISKDARMAIPNDPRHAYKAVRHMVYKRMLGGNVNIISPRKASSIRVGSMRRDLHPSARGGNRMKRSMRTDQVDSYYGRDRGFILRFQNDGTDDRYAGTRQRNMSPARRGRIHGRHWFKWSSVAHVEDAAQSIQQMIDQEISKMTI